MIYKQNRRNLQRINARRRQYVQRRRWWRRILATRELQQPEWIKGLLSCEFAAWEAASDEALRLIESDETMTAPTRPISEPIYVYLQATAGSGLLMPHQNSSTVGDHNWSCPLWL